MSVEKRKINLDKRKKFVNHLAVFKPRTKKDDNNELSERIIITARKTGELNLSSRGLATVPKRVWTINDLTKEEIEELHMNLDFDDDRDRWWEQELLKTLNLCSNSITTIDPEIENLSDLIDLDFHDNLIEELSDALKTLSKLRKLNLSHNNLNKINTSLFTLENLRHLNLSHNNIQELDPSIGDLVMLETLNLSYNNIAKLPVGLGYLVRLCNLDLSHNLLIELPPDIMSMRVVKKFDASFNHFEVTPPLGEMRKLEILNLQDNRLSVFPDVIGCTALREIYLSNNQITEFKMECLEGIGQLKSLVMSNNKIETIPDDIITLLNLERLDLSFNKLTFVSNSLCVMPNLKHLIIDGNKIKNVRRDIIQCGTPRILRHLRQGFDSESIELNRSLSPCPAMIPGPDKYMMKHTKLLSLAAQNLDQIPDIVLEDASEAKVTCVDLSRNRLTQLPDKLNLIKSIEDLKLFCNQLTSLPDWIGELCCRLRYLDLSKNQLTNLPESIGKLELLREINISHNKFTVVPECIYNISHLEILIVHDNRVKEIDASSFAKLKRLAKLDLSNNDIGHVPPELGNQTNIRTLLLSGNCFKQPRQAILVKGTDDILSYLRNQIPL